MSIMKILITGIILFFLGNQAWAQLPEIGDAKVAYHIQEMPEKVSGGGFSRLTFHLFHFPDSTNSLIRDINATLIMLNGIQPYIFYEKGQAEFFVEPSDSLRVLIRPIGHFFFELNSLKIESGKDYEISVWFKPVENLLYEDPMYPYVVPLRLDHLPDIKDGGG